MNIKREKVVGLLGQQIGLVVVTISPNPEGSGSNPVLFFFSPASLSISSLPISSQKMIIGAFLGLITVFIGVSYNTLLGQNP